MSLKPLSAEQLQAAHAWLADLDEPTRERGTEIYRSRRVMDLASYRRGVGLKAAVQGTKLYDSELRHDGTEWFGECSCPVGFDCKHCCAVMLTALEQLEATAVSPTLERPVSVKPTSFVVQIAEHLHRALTAAELKLATEVDHLFEQHRRKTEVPKASIDLITGAVQPKQRSWETVELWDAEPRDPWQAWLYIAAYARRLGSRLPAGWMRESDWQQVDALVGERERLKQIEHWRGWLRQSADKVTAARESEVELRVRLTRLGVQLDWRKLGGEYRAMPEVNFQRLAGEISAGRTPIVETSLPVWNAFQTGFGALPARGFTEPDCARILNTLLRRPEAAERVFTGDGHPFMRVSEPLTWRIETEETARIDYHLGLVGADGAAPDPPVIVLDGDPPLYLTTTHIYATPPLGGLNLREESVVIPAEALETGEGFALLERLTVAPPPRVATRVRSVTLRPVFRCAIEQNEFDSTERLIIDLLAESTNGVIEEAYERDGWHSKRDPADMPANIILRLDRRALAAAPDLLSELKAQWWPAGGHWHKQVRRNFAELFTTWLATVPADTTVILDPTLATLREPGIAATVRLEVQDAGIDWFDVRIALDVPDTTLSKKELKALLDARGGFVRLGSKGWRRLNFQLSEEDQAQLADLGLNAHEFTGGPQRLHALQLAGKRGAKRLLDEDRARAIDLRAEEIRTRVTPALPAALIAELRPYQIEGFHFLAYLSANHFGGILADDMGLGKTLQTLAWLLWQREQPDFGGQPSLVVCPKSVVDNWRTEAARFAPGLRVRVLQRGADESALETARVEADLVVANYTQLRLLEGPLTAAPWHTVVLDEAQAIKNPESQTARAAWALKAAHRLALSGTPIENRLLDLWSILQFAMPGTLGARAAFTRTFDQRSDPFARRRLSARVRPFVIRRTKSEVAKDLPARIEEDLMCELDGEQATLYRAELKHARAALLNIATQAQLDQSRFHILSSLLRLRQICCHPALVSDKAANAESAKLTALVDLLEPLIEEGHKVLVFSQFVEMLTLVEAEMKAREWRHFILTGATEDRGELVHEFQHTEGAAVFLISLRAGGFGLNLTAASYVVLFDPWWNPAVENQAIDRTHRIGQQNTVIAYRLIMKETIEEKIRALQTQKRALAADILGEENFARALSLEDFRYLLGEEGA